MIPCTVLLALFLLMHGAEVKTGVPVLIYHAVDNHMFDREGLFVSPEQFYKQMEYLHDQKYTTLTFDTIKNYYQYKKTILITFDDGYKDVYVHAFPILKKFNLQATMFLIAGLLDHPGYLTQKEIGEMSGVFSFQSHTFSHRELDKISSAELEQECGKSKEVIERITCKPVNTLSFPYGRYNKKVLTVAQKYYAYCVTTRYGIYNSADNRYKIGRIYITGSDTMDTYREKIQKGRMR